MGWAFLALGIALPFPMLDATALVLVASAAASVVALFVSRRDRGERRRAIVALLRTWRSPLRSDG